MNESLRKSNKAKYIAAFLVGFAAMVGILAIRDFFGLTDRAQIFAALCDACFVPGIMLVCVGALLFVASDGLFDMMSFGIHKAVRRTRRKYRQDSAPTTFYDYRTMKHEGRKGGFGFLLITGGVFMAAAVVFLLISEGM